MHPYCQQRGDGSIEALLQEQEALGQSQPSVSVKRIKPKEEKVPVAKPSLFKLRQGGLGAGLGQAVVAETSHPELQALEGEEDLPCLKEVSERSVPPRCSEGGFVAPESGFPVPLHRAVGKSLGTTLKKISKDLDREPENEATEDVFHCPRL